MGKIVKNNYFYFKILSSQLFIRQRIQNYSLQETFFFSRSQIYGGHYFYLAQNTKEILTLGRKYLSHWFTVKLITQQDVQSSVCYIHSPKILTLLLTSFSFGRMSNPKPSACPRVLRSEERRVGKECRSRWSPYH